MLKKENKVHFEYLISYWNFHLVEKVYRQTIQHKNFSKILKAAKAKNVHVYCSPRENEKSSPPWDLLGGKHAKRGNKATQGGQMGLLLPKYGVIASLTCRHMAPGKSGGV